MPNEEALGTLFSIQLLGGSNYGNLTVRQTRYSAGFAHTQSNLMTKSGMCQKFIMKVRSMRKKFWPTARGRPFYHPSRQKFQNLRMHYSKTWLRHSSRQISRCRRLNILIFVLFLKHKLVKLLQARLQFGRIISQMYLTKKRR